MKKFTLLIATLVAALCGSVQAQAPASSDPIVQMRAERDAVDKVYSDKKKELDHERMVKVDAAGAKAVADAKAKGIEEGVARRNAEAKVKSATKSDYDSQLKGLKKERDTARAEVQKKYPSAKSTPIKS